MQLNNWLKNYPNFIRRLIITTFVTSLIYGCSSNTLTYDDLSSKQELLTKIEQQYRTWKNTPYRYGGTSLKGADCSWLVVDFYKSKLNISMPRTTTAQAKMGYEVDQLRAGDLVFFKTGRNEKDNHVGIYYKNGQFLHISTSRGVEYNNLNHSYWKEHYWMARRIK